MTSCVKSPSSLSGKGEVESATGWSLSLSLSLSPRARAHTHTHTHTGFGFVMQSEERSSCGSVCDVKVPSFRPKQQQQQQQRACLSSAQALMNSPMESSVQYLQIPLKTPEEEHQVWNGQTLFLAENDEPTLACRSSMKHKDEHGSFDGRINPHALYNSENIDPRSGAAIALSMQAAAGLGRARAGKRKGRVSSRVPIKVFSADAANFMAMVHKLTGFQPTTCLFPGAPQNPLLLKPLPARPLHPVIQGMFNSEFSTFSGSNKVTLNSTADKSLYHSNFSSDGRTQPGSLYNGGPPTVNKSSSMQGEQAILSNLWQSLKEYSRKDEPSMDFCNENKLPHENVSGVSQENRNQDQCPGAEDASWEGL